MNDDIRDKEYTEEELAEIRRLDEIAFYENEANEYPYPRDDFSPRRPLASIDPDHLPRKEGD